MIFGGACHPSFYIYMHLLPVTRTQRLPSCLLAELPSFENSLILVNLIRICPALAKQPTKG